MTFEEIQALLLNKFGAEIIIGEEKAGLQPALIIEASSIDKVCMELRDNSTTYFDFLACITAVDMGVQENKFAVVYNLTSIPYKLSLTLKVYVENNRDPENLPLLPSVSAVWRTAEWHEREAYDLVGIFFENHPDLRRILLPDDWVGYPLRKDYTNPEYYKGIKVEY
ncbi:NADH-quinone oxidoreductase subunit C [Rubrolithibacter danxiaensis]|uniref:NADH-quinone oxidoreductase subunit C n=1 Tax=Rubrolithibacter danxiaensis TaxID=3390805 RepID=UPI003BF80F18